MKYLTLALIVLTLYACSPNPVYKPQVAAPAPTPAELGPVVSPATVGPMYGSTATIYTVPKPTDAILSVYSGPDPLVVVRGDGRIYIKGREVHTDAQYRAAMRAILMGAMGCTNSKQLEDAVNVEP
jgi:hypothetical protein